MFNRLPPLSIPNSLRRLKSGSPRQDAKDSASLKSSTSSAVVDIGSVLAQIPSKTSVANSHQKPSAATASTPPSALPLSAYSIGSSTRSSVDTTLTTPASGPPGTITFAIRPGVLPDPSPDQTYFPVVHTLPDSQSKVVTWKERQFNATGDQQAVHGAPVLQRPSEPSNGTKEPGVFDASLNRVHVDEDLNVDEIPIQDLERLHVTGTGPKDKASPGNGKAKDKTQGTKINWDPINPGHDTWNESGRDEKVNT